MNYITTNFTTDENEKQGMELIKQQSDKMNELFIIVQEKEEEINSLKKENLILNKIQNDLNISQQNYIDMKNKFENCHRCLIDTENNYNKILNKCNNLSISLKNLSDIYINFENQKNQLNKLKNDNINFQKELNQKNNRIETLIGKDKVNNEKIKFLEEKENKNKEKINKLKNKVQELTLLNQDLLNQKNKLENDYMNNINKLNQLQNSIEDKNNLSKNYKELFNKFKETENNFQKNNTQLDSIKKENLKLTELNHKKEKIESDVNEIIQNNFEEIFSLINLTKNNLDLISKGNINIKPISVSSKNYIKNEISSIPSLSKFHNLYNEIIGINLNLENIILSYTKNSMKNIKDLYDKIKNNENEIHHLKNKLDSVNKNLNECETNLKKKDLNFEIIKNELNQDIEKLKYKIKSIHSLLKDSFKKITDQYIIISNVDNFPQNLKIKKFHDIEVKEMILDYEKIFKNFSDYVKILINEKKRLDNLGKKSEECKNDLNLLLNEIDNMKKNPINLNNQNINCNEINLNDKIMYLTQELNQKTEELEQLCLNYNLLYNQYHILLNKEKRNCNPCSNSFIQDKYY